jgi:hypothetical protein
VSASDLAAEFALSVADSMSEIVWMKPYLTAIRLASHWNIHLQTAEQIVWGVMQAGRAWTVRGRRQFERGLRDISEEIGAVMRRRAYHLKEMGFTRQTSPMWKLIGTTFSKMAASYSARSSAAIVG